MSKRSLVIGMGIGNLYKDVLTKLGHQVVTVDQDSAKGADFESVDSALVVHGLFDTAHICTPNFTHFEIAARVAPHTKIVFIEKPGVATSDTWSKLVTKFNKTR
jgi:predicted dehydrogenase